MVRLKTTGTSLLLMALSSVNYAGDGDFENLLMPASKCVSIETCPAGSYLFEGVEGEQQALDIIFQKMKGYEGTDNPNDKKAEFSNDRYALFFKPQKEKIPLKVTVGYYTQVLGLGDQPEDVTLAELWAINQCYPLGCTKTGALNNFWRGVENIAVDNPGNLTMWAVSQASAMRRVYIKSTDSANQGMILCDYTTNKERDEYGDCGYASGGFMANVKVDGTLNSGSQQQFLFRNTSFTGTVGGAWNMVYLGTNQAPSAPTDDQKKGFTNPWPGTNGNAFPLSYIPAVTKIAEKPHIVFTDDKYYVKVPKETISSSGVHWSTNEDSVLLLIDDEFTVITPKTDLTKLDKNKHLLFMPGVYELNQPLVIDKANTIVLGVGLPSIKCTGSKECIDISASGVKFAGIMLEAGYTGDIADTTSLLKVSKPSQQGDAGNSTYLYDLYCRVGGEIVASVKTCVIIDQDNVIGDNLWLWRADHGTAGAGNPDPNIGWTQNRSNNGIIINGDNVTLYGLAVEHHQKYQTVWNGNNGNLVFYQSELPYDPMKQENWTNCGEDANTKDPQDLGCTSYKLGDSVTSHQAVGLGIYSFFSSSEAPIYLTNAIETPKGDNIKLEHMVTIYLNGDTEHPEVETGIQHIINGTGAPAIGSVDILNEISEKWGAGQQDQAYDLMKKLHSAQEKN